jgi:hypothetical protein
MTSSDVIGTGTAGGLLAFCDDLLERDHASCGPLPEGGRGVPRLPGGPKGWRLA